MKKHILGCFAVVGMFAAVQSAKAEKFEIYVTNAQYISPSHGELYTIVQKDIVLDTDTNTLTLPLAEACTDDLFCQEVIRKAGLKVTAVTFQNQKPETVQAEGSVVLNGRKVRILATLTQNADNATVIKITTTNDCKAMTSNLIGGPAELAQPMKIMPLRFNLGSTN